MTQFKRPLFRTLASLLMALALLLQVQNTFACEMMDISGPVESCCCELEQGMECCELDSKLTWDGADMDAREPSTNRAIAKLEVPEAVSFLVVSLLWPSVSLNHTRARVRYDSVATIDQSYPPLYSLTQRFRI